MFAQMIHQLPRRKARQFRECGPTLTDFSALSGKSVIALLDAENMTFSGRQHHAGREPHARLLLESLKLCARSVTPMAFACVPEEALPDAYEYFLSSGWKPYLTRHQRVHHIRGPKLLANSDPQIFLHAGSMISRSNADTVLILSGDGDLVDHIARYTAELPKRRSTYVCSVRGSTSARALAENNKTIAGNIFVGSDVLVMADTLETYPQ